jgi:hypothetical protein
MTKREMTIEEAIEIFKEVRAEVLAKETELSKQVFENLGLKAVELAIKVLEQQPCEDCISREAVIKIFGEVHPMDYNTQAYIKNIQNLSSVTPSRPKGKWIHWTDDYKDYVTCSCCGYGEEGEVLLSDKTPFCPICGADMRGEAE